MSPEDHTIIPIQARIWVGSGAMSPRFFALPTANCSPGAPILSLVMGTAIAVFLTTAASAASSPSPAAGPWVTRTGIPVVIVPAPETSWAVVQLHIRTAGEGLLAEQALGLSTFAAALARAGDARGRPATDMIAAVGGETHITRTLDSVVITDALPASHLNAAFKATEDRLRERRRLVPPLVPVATLPQVDAAPPSIIRQLVAPGHPYAYPDDGAVPPRTLTALSERLLRRDNMVIVVIAPTRLAVTLAALNRQLRTMLPRGSVSIPAVQKLEGARVALAPFEPDVMTSLWLPTVTSDETQRAERRAALLVLADLLGARSGSAAAFDWLTFKVHAREGAEGERARLNELRAAARGLDDHAIAASRHRARTLLARSTQQPELLALRRGNAALLGLDDLAVDTALTTLKPEAVRVLAQELAEGGRIVLRQERSSKRAP